MDKLVKKEDYIELGTSPGSSYKYLMRQFAPLTTARSEFSLVADKVSPNKVNLYAIGGFNSELGLLDTIE